MSQERVFSLLSLHLEFTRVSIDYEQTLPNLAYAIIDRYGDSLCICDILVDLDSLGLLQRGSTDAKSLGNIADWSKYDIEIDMADIEFGFHREWVTIMDSHEGMICPVVQTMLYNFLSMSQVSSHRAPMQLHPGRATAATTHFCSYIND